MNYGAKIKEIRENNKITQKEMAEILKLSRATYGHYETQYQIMPLNHLIDFCSYFNIPLDYVFGFTLSKQYTIINNNINKNNICARLKQFRKENHLTQEKLAYYLNTTKTVICGYERGRYLIATPFLYTICKKYNISADYLLGRTDEPINLNQE